MKRQIKSADELIYAAVNSTKVLVKSVKSVKSRVLKVPKGKSVTVIGLVGSGKFKTQQCIADYVGLSRQRVSQILQESNINFGRKHSPPGTILRWSCPLCGSIIEMKPSLRNVWKRSPAHCRPCAAKFCNKGLHLRSKSNVGVGKGEGRRYKTCKDCNHERLSQIVDYRICIDCKREVPIKLNNQNRMKRQGIPKRCRSCQARRASAMNRKEKHGRSKETMQV